MCSDLFNDEKNQLEIFKQRATSKQLDTSKNTLFMIFETDNQLNHNIEIKKRFQQLKNVTFQNLSSIDQIFFNVTIRKSRKKKFFADLNEINIIQKKRIQRFNSKYAGMTILIINQNLFFFVFHMIFIIDITIINQSMHNNDLSNLFSN